MTTQIALHWVVLQVVSHGLLAQKAYALLIQVTKAEVEAWGKAKLDDILAKWVLATIYTWNWSSAENEYLCTATMCPQSSQTSEKVNKMK